MLIKFKECVAGPGVLRKPGQIADHKPDSEAARFVALGIAEHVEPAPEETAALPPPTGLAVLRRRRAKPKPPQVQGGLSTDSIN